MLQVGYLAGATRQHEWAERFERSTLQPLNRRKSFARAKFFATADTKAVLHGVQRCRVPPDGAALAPFSDVS